MIQDKKGISALMEKAKARQKNSENKSNQSSDYLKDHYVGNDVIYSLRCFMDKGGELYRNIRYFKNGSGIRNRYLDPYTYEELRREFEIHRDFLSSQGVTPPENPYGKKGELKDGYGNVVPADVLSTVRELSKNIPYKSEMRGRKCSIMLAVIYENNINPNGDDFLEWNKKNIDDEKGNVLIAIGGKSTLPSNIESQLLQFSSKNEDNISIANSTLDPTLSGWGIDVTIKPKPNEPNRVDMNVALGYNDTKLPPTGDLIFKADLRDLFVPLRYDNDKTLSLIELLREENSKLKALESSTNKDKIEEEEKDSTIVNEPLEGTEGEGMVVNEERLPDQRSLEDTKETPLDFMDDEFDDDIPF